MHSSLKIAAALLVNLSFLCHEVFAQLPPISFESYQSQPVDLSSPDPWDSVSGTSTVTPAGEGFGGGKALKIGVAPEDEAWLRKPVTWNPAETVAFIDFRIKPAATPSGSQANFFANGSLVALPASRSLDHRRVVGASRQRRCRSRSTGRHGARGKVVPHGR